MSLSPDGCVIDGVTFSSCQLYWRRWIIHANDAIISDMNGEAVIGKMQRICTPLPAPKGSVEGAFTFVPGRYTRYLSSTFLYIKMFLDSRQYFFPSIPHECLTSSGLMVSASSLHCFPSLKCIGCWDLIPGTFFLKQSLTRERRKGELTYILISSTIKSKYDEAWSDWTNIPVEVKMMWFGEFKKVCTWDLANHEEVVRIFHHKGAAVVRHSLADIRRGKSKGKWLQKSVLSTLHATFRI